MIENNQDYLQPGKSYFQDRDLFTRLNQYMDTAELNLKQGRGWFIFNADRPRNARITHLLLQRLAEYRPFISYYHVPWRDFSLNAYIRDVELVDEKGIAAQARTAENQQLKKELNIAQRVTTATSWAMLTNDLLVISGLSPRYKHETLRLFEVLEGRLNRQLASILVTPRMPHELAADFSEFDQENKFWKNLYQRMYDTGYVAL